MKKILIFVMACVAMAFTTAAQQQGVVRSVERPKQPSKGIEGATVSILELKNDLVTDKDGKFSFIIRGKKTGDPFKVSRVQKKGYTLIDKQLQGRKFSYSSTVPIEIVMVSDKQLAADTKLIEDKAFAKAKKTYEARIAELERQLAEKTITEQEYYAERELAINDYDKYIQLIDEMAEHYAMTDYKGLSDINRQIQECIENAELERADSLINSKGDFDQREQALFKKKETTQRIGQLYNKSQEDYQYSLNDLAQDYYNKYTILAANFHNDSAACWLERRANLDSTNIEWQKDAGGFIFDYLANYTLAMEYYLRGLRQSRNQYGEESDWSAKFYNNIGNVYGSLGDYKLAMEFHQKALGIRLHVLGSDHPDIAQSYNNLGNVYYFKGDQVHALEYYQKSINIYERNQNIDLSSVALPYHNIGNVYSKWGDYDQALKFYQKSLIIRIRVSGTDHYEVANLYNNIGNVFFDQSDYAQALWYYQNALDIQERVLGRDHLDVAYTYNNLGSIYRYQGDFIKALDYYNKSLAIRKCVLGENHNEVAISYNNIGWVYRALGNYKKALEYFEKALAIRQQKLGDDHSYTKETKRSIEIVKMLLGEE